MANVYDAIGITGVTADFLDPSLLLYVDQNDIDATNFETKLYKDAAHTTLVGHTATYTTTGAKAIVADNGSGLGGTITVGTLVGTTSDIVLDYGRWGVVSAIVANLLTLHCPVLTGFTVGAIWRAPTVPHVVPMLLNIPGEFAESSESAALWTLGKIPGVWNNGRAHLVRYGVRSFSDNGGDLPSVNIMIGSVLCDTTGTYAGQDVADTAMTWEAKDLDPINCVANYEDTIELSVTAGDTGDTDLSVWTVWVVE